MFFGITPIIYFETFSVLNFILFVVLVFMKHFVSYSITANMYMYVIKLLL